MTEPLPRKLVFRASGLRLADQTQATERRYDWRREGVRIQNTVF